jgi:phosphodiesterase/alkaline phosphatase D-like protein
MTRALALLTAFLALGLGQSLAAQSWPNQEQSSISVKDAQVVAGPIPEKITSTSAVVWWLTTAPEESILVYGTAPDEQPYRVQRPWSTRTHEVSVKKLEPATTYYVAVLQPDGARSAVGRFATQPVGYGRAGNVRITNGPLFQQITPDSATITWSANMASSFLVHYGTDPQNLNQPTTAPWTPTTHRIVLQGLRPDTHYYFTIEATQQLPEPDQQDEESSQPPPSSAPFAQVYAFRTLARGQQALSIGPRH